MSKLSVCLIVRDEEKNLARALKSVRGLADEIVVVDTGSTDSTIDIAKKAGAKVIEHEWQNDFSEARNFSLDQASCEWVLQLDADEALSESSRRIRELFAIPKFDAYYLQVVNLVAPGRFDGAVNHRSNRLFKRQLWRYEGVIHECPTFLEDRRPKIAWSGLEIIHWGYADKEAAPRRFERNQALLKRALWKNSGDYLLHFYLGGAFLQMSRWEEALDAFQEADKLRPPNSHNHHALIVTKICECLWRMGHLEEARIQVGAAAKRFYDYRDILFLAGMICEDCDDYGRAAEYYESCARIEIVSPNYPQSQAGLDREAARRADRCRQKMPS